MNDDNQKIPRQPEVLTKVALEAEDDENDDKIDDDEENDDKIEKLRSSLVEPSSATFTALDSKATQTHYATNQANQDEKISASASLTQSMKSNATVQDPSETKEKNDESAMNVHDTSVAAVPMTNLSRAHPTSSRPGAVRVNMPGVAIEEPEDDASRHDVEEAKEAEEQQITFVSQEEINAELVDDRSDRDRIRETIQEVISSQTVAQAVDLEAEDRFKRARQQRRQCFYAVVATVLTSAVIVAVLMTRGATAPPSEEPTTTPTQAPTARLSAVLDAVEEGFGPINYDNTTLPEKKAIQWLSEQDTIILYPLESEEDQDIFNDRYAVAVLAYATGYETWTDSTNWMEPDLSVCDNWQGLTCNDDGRVTVLDLAVNNLTGTIPTELGRLGKLDVIFMFRNSLGGTIPSELGMLDDVDFFYLNENQLTGSLPNELSGLLDADDIFLFGNNLTGTIPDSFGNFVDLVNLYLDGNELFGTIPSSLQRLKRVQRLYLHDNQLEGTIPSELGAIISLERLQLHKNRLTGAVPPSLESILALSVLTLQGNNLSGIMPDDICELRTNRSIDSLVVLVADCETGNIVCDCCSECF